MQVDWRTGRPGLGTVVGGFSGPAIKPVALRCAWECSRAVEIPIIGCGGIGSAEDVLEFMVAGCTLVQIGTASFADPGLPERIATALPGLLEEASISDIRELIGAVSYPEPWLAANRGAER
jgi:dihydroorotate dehydrogenase (NAD+) catalytic subunit